MNFQRFKKQAAEFFKYAKNATHDQIENGFKCLTISYFDVDFANDLEKYQATMILDIAAKNHD